MGFVEALPVLVIVTRIGRARPGTIAAGMGLVIGQILMRR